MVITVLSQPFASDGSAASLGRLFEIQLRSGAFERLRVCSAYAASGGTSRVFGAVRDFVRGGGTAEIYVGLGNGVTSVQAVAHLLAAGAAVLGCETGGTVLFHPKVYLLEGARRAWLAVGSSNLTKDGLFRNYEVSTVVEIDLALAVDSEYVASVRDWFDSLGRFIETVLPLRDQDTRGLVATGRLVDEAVQVQREPQRLLGAPRRHRRTAVTIPPAPPPHPDAPLPPRRRTSRRPARAGRGPRTVVADTASRFAMTLSAFDCSHRREVKGTPEVSLPESAACFFPPATMGGRRYPDAYFDVVLNDERARTQSVTYRLWRRPPGSRSGHADWRINVTHDTIDLTARGGGDILLMERLPDGSAPAYEAWVVHAADPIYLELLARCDQEVGAAGRAGTKRFGLF